MIRPGLFEAPPRREYTPAERAAQAAAPRESDWEAMPTRPCRGCPRKPAEPGSGYCADCRLPPDLKRQYDAMRARNRELIARRNA